MLAAGGSEAPLAPRSCDFETRILSLCGGDGQRSGPGGRPGLTRRESKVPGRDSRRPAGTSVSPPVGYFMGSSDRSRRCSSLLLRCPPFNGRQLSMRRLGPVCSALPLNPSVLQRSGR